MSSCTIPTSAAGTARNYANYPEHETTFYQDNGRSYAAATSYAAISRGLDMNASTANPATVPVSQYKAPISCGNPDPWRDQEDSRECNQLNLQSLMPQNWQSTGECVLEGNGADNWARYSVTPDAYARYVASAGACRVMAIERPSLARRTGLPNMLRSEAMPALTLGPDSVIFNDSSDRWALANPQYRNFFGCGQ